MDQDVMPRDDAEWKRKLTPEQYRALREKDTEAPFSGAHMDNHENGMYRCAGCGAELFSSDTKFDSGTGWPSFYDVADKGNVVLKEDTTLGMRRTEVLCAACGGHLGHLFNDGPQEKSGKRYCINSCALEFDADKNDQRKSEKTIQKAPSPDNGDGA